jgi:hypothetical protein
MVYDPIFRIKQTETLRELTKKAMSTHLKMRIMNTTKFNQFYPMSNNQIKQTKAIKLNI